MLKDEMSPLRFACCLLLAACTGCGDKRDAKVAILRKPGDVARIHVIGFEEVRGFEVSSGQTARVLEAMRPMRMLKTPALGVSIAEIKVETKEGKDLHFMIHEYGDAFVAHTFPDEEPGVYFTGRDAERLKSILREAREAKRK